MTFWAYMIQCGDRHFYVGHTNDLEQRIGQHQAGTFRGYTSTRQPVHLVWSQEFGTRYEAVEAERRLKGWGKAKKLALIRGDWDQISVLARNRQGEGRASTGSARTEWEEVLEPRFLHPHPAEFPSEPFSLEVSFQQAPGRLRVRYRLTGPVHLLSVPRRRAAERRDNLWRHSCFELFGTLGAGGYVEFNFSPSTEWAAYRFSGYRDGMAELEMPAPEIAVSQAERSLELSADIALPTDIRPTRLGVSAVIEELSGRKSYWALAHPEGDKPDFHHPDCFAIELPPASAA